MDPHLEPEDPPSPFAGLPCYPQASEDEWPVGEPEPDLFDRFVHALPKLSAGATGVAALGTMLFGLEAVLGPLGWMCGGFLVALIVATVVLADSTWRR